jgi:hypothetical protein
VSRYRDQVIAALRAVTIRGPTQYAWLGRRSRLLSAELRAEMDDAQQRRYLVASLREELYSSLYCRGRPVPARWGEPEPVAEDPRLVDALSRANAGHGCWENGWTIRRVEHGDAVVAMDRLRARVALADCLASDLPILPGATVGLRLPKELPASSPGFFTVLGDAMAGSPSSAGLVRVYWNVTRAGAPRLVELITGRLNVTRAPFQLKVGDHPHRLDRCDAAVLYLGAETFVSTREMLRGIGVELTAHLRPRIPAFTLETLPGVGLAEDDGTGESFGLRRCELLADGIVRAHECGITRMHNKLAAVAEHFARAGVQIDAPYREPSLAGRHVL